MKIVVASLFLILSSIAFGQKITYNEVLMQQKKKIKLKDIPSYTSYLSKEGIEYSVGDTIEFGSSKGQKGFKTLWLFKSVLTMYALPSTYQNQRYSILKIQSANNVVSVTLKLGMGGVNKNFNIRTFDFESSIIEGEIKRNGLTSDEALQELKKAKDKLDLGLITQEEFDKLKAELAPIIK